MYDLHVSQEKLLKILKANIDSPLTIREIQEELELASPSVVYHHIQQLEKKGYLKRNSNNSKGYVVLDTPEKDVVYINKYGFAHCGPKGTILSGNPVDRIPIASRLLRFPSEEGFIMEARGNSMEPKIKQGDLVIAQVQIEAENGDIVVCVNDGEVLIKKYYRKDEKTIILHSLNSEAYHPFLAGEDFKIEGVVKNILHYD